VHLFRTGRDACPTIARGGSPGGLPSRRPAVSVRGYRRIHVDKNVCYLHTLDDVYECNDVHQIASDGPSTYV